MNTRELIHRFNSQTHNKGKTGNVFFEQNKLYDYGYHFLMAHILPNGVALINSKKYSVTTAKHLSYTRQALSNRKCFEVPFPSQPYEAGNVEHLENEMIRCLDKVLSSRRDAEFWFRQFNKAHASLTEYCYLFEFKSRIPKIPVEFLDELSAIVEVSKEKAKLWEQNKSVKRKEQEKQRALDAKEKIELWLKGTIDNIPNSYVLPTMLRIKGNLVETSHGAKVPLDEALNLFARIESGTAKQGDRCGDFEFTRVNNEQEIVIGCHRIDFDEAKRVLQQYL